MVSPPDVAAEAAEALQARFFDFKVDHRLLTEILDARPELAGVAAKYGWDDTELAERLADAVAWTLLGRNVPTYGDLVADSDAFWRDLGRAHDAWVEGRVQADEVRQEGLI